MVLMLILASNTAFAQLAVPFSPRLPGGNIKIKGDIVLIGNSIITGEGLSLPYNGNGNNNNLNGAYINVASGGDPNIFSSSTADLEINNSCKNIVFAGLYWASVYPNEVGTNSGQQFQGTPRIEDWNQIKFKLPTGGFIDLEADNNADPVGDEDDIIFDGYDAVNINNSFKDSPIICYKNVTSLLQGLTEADGTYTVANQRATRGSRTGGCAAGWTLVVIYESPLLPSKFISVFDGYAGVQGTTILNIPVSGYQTLPAPFPVNAKIGVSALEGDLGIRGDSFRFRATTSPGVNYTALSDVVNPANNFFNSNITINGVDNTSRNPASINTLGFDINNVIVPNPSNQVIPNNSSSGELRLTTRGDGYGAFVTSFAVDIIEPNIVLTKIVLDEFGNDIGGEVVDLGQQLNYVIGFQNIGNDDATDFTIRDILPPNIVFNYPSDIDPLPTGITVESYDAATREIIFRVDDTLVEEFGPVSEIRFSVQVVEFCNLLNDACSNNVSNQAFSTYRSNLNPSFIISDDPSYDINNGCLLTPQATNFLADINDCTYNEEIILCGASTVLTAPGGYDTYSWSTDPSGTPVIGTNQSITVTSTGTYYARNTAVAPCQSTNQVFEVITFGANVANPVLPYADQIVICPNDGKELPNIFLCGGAGGKFIQTNLSDSTSLIWERLDESSCAAVIDQDCANEVGSCVWNQVATGPNYMADTAGQFRLTVNYPGGCFNRFYFNVYSNVLTPNVTESDIICNTQGEIVVGGVPSGYEYSIDGTNYQTSNTFVITTPNFYTVYIRQVGVSPNPCIFTVPDVQIRQRNFTVSTIINQPFCNGDLGNIVIAVNDAEPQYFYSISQGGTPVNSVGPVINRNYTFSNLNPGTYTIDISTEDGCTYTQDVEIIEPALLQATSALTTPLTCVDGEITVYPVGGTAPYFYFVNGSTDFETIPTIPVTAPGVFDITVVDSNNCSAQTSITVDEIPAPVFNIVKTDVLCYGDNSGEIQFNVTNANGFVVEYSIDNGVTYVASPTFSNLIAGTFPTIIRYSLNGIECFGSPQDIIINEPAEAVTATAGVSELAGCGPSGEGRVRITNPQGGVAPYEYSFDNQATWSNINDAYLAPGTYTLYIRDANGCVFPMPNVTVDPEPLAPTIDISDPDFNCDGSANSTVTITNTGGNSFTYTYLLDGVENPNTADPTVFLNVPDGPHTVTVTYQLQTVPTFSNLLNETFGYGEDTSSPGMNTTYYCFERQVVATQCKGNPRINDGDYSVTADIISPFGAWIDPVDHTPATSPPTPKGRFLVVNIGSLIPTSAILYEKTINDIIPNQPLNVEFYALNLVRSSSGIADPDLTVALIDGSGTEISSFSTGNIPKTEQWENYSVSLNPGSNTNLRFVVRSNVQLTSGNDVAIDDIRVFQLPTTCTTTVDFPIVIGTGNAFDASVVSATDVTCFGASDGTVTISAQNFDTVNGFQYSLDAGVTWVTQLTSPYTITGLATGNQNIQIRYEDAVDTCEFVFNQNIGTPTPVGVSATATPITCLDGATVTATGSGGTPGYSYELLDTSLNLISNFPNTGVLTNIGAGDYIIRVTDANNCTETTTLNLVDPTPPTASIINADYCYDAANGTSLEVSASGGQAPYQYNINGSGFQSNPVFNNLASGTYTIIVRDAYGCTFTLPAETIATQVNVSAVLTKELDCTAIPNASITATISDGYPPYTYAVSFNGGAYTDLGNVVGTSFTYDATTNGTYQFQVTDSNSCPILSNIITVSPVELPTATTTVVNPSCNGDANGSAQIVPANGVGPYEYSFDGSAFSTTSLYTGLSAGINYAYEVRDSKNCVFSNSVTLTEPTVLVVSASATAFSCNASNTNQSALVTIALPTTGTAPYAYSFNGSGYSSSNTLTVNDNGADQTITYSVQDAQGCIAGGSVTLLQLDPPTDLTFSSTAITCLATSSTVTLTATDGVGTLEYETISPSPIIEAKQTSNVFTGLTPGTYVFRVTDANGCYYTESYIIDAVTPINIVGFKLSDVFCFGDNTGAIQYTVSGFAGTYSSALTNGSGSLVQTGTTIDLTDLIADTYTLQVTDDITGCTASETIVISQPISGLTFTATSTNVFCSEDNSQITVSASNGTPNYTYAAVLTGAAAPVTYASSNVITVDTNSAADLVWDVYVIDANDCITMNTVTIIADTLPTVTVPALTANQCNVTSGFTFTATGTNGVTPYQYSINGGASYQSSPTFAVNTPGTYTITIRDANGCTANSPTPVEIFELITTSALLTKDITCAPAPTDASIDISISGGNAPYTYEVSTDGGTTYTSIAGSPYTTSTAGNYQFRITDANSCTQETNVVMVNATATVSVSETQVNPTCNGSTDGSIRLTATSGEAPFTYSIDGGTTFVSSNVFGGLIAGNYNYIVRDNKGCDATGTITISDPDPIDPVIGINGILCNTVTPGSFDVRINSGGTAPYVYTLYDNSFIQIATYTETSSAITPVYNFGGLGFGDYYITIVDAIGCEYQSPKLRIEPTPYLNLTSQTATATCATGVEVELNVSGGIPDYTYSIFGQPATAFGPTSLTSHTFTGLDQGTTYQFEVIDVNGCPSYLEITTPIISPIEINPISATNVSCNGADNGEVSFTVDQYDASVTELYYEVRDNLTNVAIIPARNGNLIGLTGTPANATITGLSAGNYTLYVREVDGTFCTATEPFQITQPVQSVNATVIGNINANCNTGAQVTISATGGTGPYEYAFAPAPTIPTVFDGSNVLNLDPNVSTNWNIIVRDINNCEFALSETIDTDPLPTINPVPPQCFNGTPINIILVEGTGSAITPLTYSIGGSYQASPNFTIGTAGTYNVSVRDGNGCIATDIFILQPPLLLNADLTKELDCTVSPDAQIFLTPSGGVGPFTYEVNFNGGGYAVIGSSTYTATNAGTYQFRVTDSQLPTACTSESNSITINALTTPTLTETHVDVTCNGGADGSIVVTASNGIAPYEYSNDNGVSFQASNVFNGLSAATYNIVVRDSKNCTSLPEAVVIDQPAQVGGSGALNQGLTCGIGNATQPAEVEITGSGGTAPYTYSFNGGINYTTTNTYTTFTSGTVSALVKDANGCIIATVIDVVVPALNAPTDLGFTATAVTCSALTSNVTLATTNGVGPLTYAIIAPASATGNTSGDASGIYTGLAPDTYTFTVRDNNGCTYTESYTVNPVTNITVSGLLVSDVSCNAGSDGAVDFTVGDFASTYSYTINGGGAITGQSATTINLTGLPIGNQVIIVTDETTDCTATFTITISEPTALSLTETVNINATCNFDAQVTVEATGGTPNYRYAFVQDGVAPIATDYTASASAVLDPTININWDVWVIDANDCTDQIDVVIATDALPTVTVPALASNQCNLTGDPYTFTVTATTGIAPFTYSIGSGFQSSTTFTVASPGNYFVNVRDANGCEAISPTSVTVYPTIDLSPSVTVLPSCADDDGEITLTGSGGSGNYTYSISPTPGSISITTNVISGVPAGTYTVTITDTTTLCTRDISVTVDAPTPVTFTSTPTPVSCSGGSDGVITVNLPASNDNPIYTYSLDGGVTTQTSNVFSGLVAGIYNVTVTSGRNCTLTQPETVIDPNPITIPAPTVVEYACTANTNTTVFARITVNSVTGGSSNYTIYEFIRGGTIVQANASNIYTEADLLGGTYTINVYDDNGCFETTTATIQPFIRLDTLDITVDNAITCTNDEDITVSVTSTGGTPANLQYTVEDVDGAIIGAVYSQINPTGVFTNLAVGNYLVTVLNLDSGCSLQTTHYVDEPNTFDLTIDNVVDVTCFTDSDGTVDVTFIDRSPTPTDESGAFNYNIVDALGNPVTSGIVANAGPTTISGLVSGTYTITASLTNTPFCTISKNFTINAPTAALAISETHTEITCVSGNNDGSISASATGGWPGGYEYQLELTSGTIITPFGNVSNFTALTAGDYIVSVRDSRGCIASTNVLLVIPTPIDAQIAATPTLVSCFGDTNASITVSNVTGGQAANYTYTLNMVLPTVTASGPQNSNVFGGLGAGTYNVTVRDGWNCEFTTADVVITEPTDIQSSLVKATSQTCLTGSTLTLSAIGGTGPYEYSDTMNFATVLGSFASDITFNVTPGAYQYYVRDANACDPAISNEITIDPLPELIVNIDATNATINCTGDITGVIVANAIGGLGDYTYILQDGSGTDITPAPTQNRPGVFTELPAGIYQVRVTSGIDCEAVSIQVEITEPDFALQVSYTVTDVACSGGNDGILEIVATGGTGIIKYAISPQLNQFFETAIFEDLPAGTYQAIAQDELGCFVLLDFVVDEPAPVMLSLVPNSIIPEACIDELDGEFSVNLTGGNLPYSVSLDNINGTYTTGALTQTEFDFTGLAGGDHVVYVRDNLGCESEWNITFPESVRIVTELDIAYCTDNLNDASINMVTATVDDTLVNLTDIDYSLDGGAFQVNNTFMDILPGNHFITVRHTNTCESIINFEIEQFDPLQLVIDEGGINEIIASSTGGSGVYEYEVQFENASSSEFSGSTNTFPIYESGNYTVTVTDSNGCVASATAFFEYIDVCITNYFTPNNDNRQDEWGPGCTDQYPNLTVNIFDRYGREVSKLRGKQTWDGTYNGADLPSGDYWYVVKLNDQRDDREFVGHFTLYR